MLTMHQQITVKTLFKQGIKQTEIARELGCHRNTVRNIIRNDQVIEKQTRDRPSYFSPYHDQIKVWREKDVSNLRMYEILRETYAISRTYDSLCKYIQKQFPETPEAFGVQVTGPGEEAEVDFGYAGLQPVNPPGMPLIHGKTWVLAVKLSHSRTGFHRVTRDQKVTTLTSGITAAFEYFGGVPRRLKIDNLRAAIIKNQHYDLLYNQQFLEWANHYGCVINPCAPYHPEQKGKVEAEVKYVKNNFFVEREFTDWTDMVNRLTHWTAEYANRRTHSITRRVPWEVLAAEERAALLPLPQNPFPSFEQAERVVQKNCHLFFKNNYYSVPARLAGKTVTIRFTGGLLRVIDQGEEAACHAVSAAVGQYITCRSHLPGYKCYGVTEYQQKYEAKMANIGEYAHTYFKEILLKRDSYWFKAVRSILGLVNRYGNEAVNLSLQRALHFNVLDISVIARIVEQQLYRLDVAPKLPKLSSAVEPVIPQVPSQLPLSEDINRDLSYYQQLLER